MKIPKLVFKQGFSVHTEMPTWALAVSDDGYNILKTGKNRSQNPTTT